jgi:hypothetical protein
LHQVAPWVSKCGYGWEPATRWRGGAVGIAIFDAVGLAKRNKAAYEELLVCQRLLQRRCEAESSAQSRERRACYESALAPFRDIFARIKNVDLAELNDFDVLPTGALPEADLRNVRVGAAGLVTAMAGGAATGAAAGAATFAAVGALATASTGTAISSLSGAAATSATLAWLGGGAVAAGGGGVAAGTAVLTGVVTGPVVLALAGFLEYKGRQQRRRQQETAVLLADAAALFDGTGTRVAEVLRRSKQIREILRALRTELSGRLPALDLLVRADVDYRTYTTAERRRVAEAVGLATTLVTVMSAEFVDEEGHVTDLSARVLEDATDRLRAAGAA